MIQANSEILNEEMNAVMNTEIMNNKDMNNKERGQVKRRIGWLRGKIEEYGKELSELLSSMPEVEEKVRGKGRPTKAKKVPEEVEDLFAQLVISNMKNTEVVEVVDLKDTELEAVVEEAPKKLNKAKKHMLTEEEKEAKKAALEEEKLAKKAALEEEKLAKKAALEEEKLAKKALEKEQKAFLEAEKKILKKLEDDKKKQALEEEKASKKVPKKSTKKPVEAVVEAVAEAVVEAVPEEKATKVTVTRITIGDMKYLKSNTNVLYNETTKEEVGLYDADTNTIKPLPEDDDAEMTEDEYYESDNDRY